MAQINLNWKQGLIKLVNYLNTMFTDIYTNFRTNTLTQNTIWMGNTSNQATESSTVIEWGIGVSQPGQKESKGLVTEMIISDGSVVSVPTVFHKTIILTTSGTVQLLPDTYTNRYYIIESIFLIARSPSLSQYPTLSIGNNSSTYDNIAASQTLNSLANGKNIITLTSAASLATIQANSSMYLNITNPAIGSGSFEIVIKGFLTNL